jgi:hypothetical protein
MTYDEWLKTVLLTIIPHERGYKMAEERTEYRTVPDALLSNVPLP